MERPAFTINPRGCFVFVHFSTSASSRRGALGRVGGGGVDDDPRTRFGTGKRTRQAGRRDEVE